MSTAVVEQVKQLISELPVAEKVGVAEWLEAVLRRDAGMPPITKRKKTRKTTKSTTSAIQKLNGSAGHAPVAETPWEERPWTQEEIQELMKPDPKTGAEIAAWLEANPNTGEWGEMDIPDVVEWVRELRHKISRRQEWDA